MRAGAYAAIFDDEDRVLLCHRRDMDMWNLPGGLVEPNEAPWEAAVREASEEVGLAVEIERLTGLYWKPGSDEVVFQFACRVIGGTPGTSDEADAVGYFSVDELPANTVPKQVERIRDALARSATPFLRVQPGPSAREVLAARAQTNTTR